MILETLLPALLPAAVDAVKTAIGRIGGATPKTVEELVAVEDAKTRRIEALAKLDQPTGPVSPWVANLRASSRYIATLALIGNAMAQAAFGTDPQTIQMSIDMGQAGFAFLFGDRVYTHLKRGPA